MAFKPYSKKKGQSVLLKTSAVRKWRRGGTGASRCPPVARACSGGGDGAKLEGKFRGVKEKDGELLIIRTVTRQLYVRAGRCDGGLRRPSSGKSANRTTLGQV